MELGGGGWSRVEVGARFSNTLLVSHIYNVHVQKQLLFCYSLDCFKGLFTNHN